MRPVTKAEHCFLLIFLYLLCTGLRIPDNSISGRNSYTFDESIAYKRNKNIGRGINFGNALEAPNEGEWGMTIKESNVQAIADSVKIRKLAAGTYTVIFDSDYIDKVNAIHYSVVDTINIRISQQTLIKDDSSSLSNVYPVPASHMLIVDNMTAGCNYMIYDLKGQLQLSGKVMDEGIDVSDLRSGEYILRVMEDTNTILSRRIVVVH